MASRPWSMGGDGELNGSQSLSTIGLTPAAEPGLAGTPMTPLLPLACALDASTGAARVHAARFWRRDYALIDLLDRWLAGAVRGGMALGCRCGAGPKSVVLLT
eukprot:scaffold14938_cov130-Isochrysis_galbana.AAC.2